MTAGSEPDPIADAIAALTTAARRERTIGAGTPNEHTEPVDFGEIACHVITAVAANVGGVEALLAGRPGSWEADYVRQIVQSTAGDDDTELMRYRTEPVRIEVDVEAVFYDFGLTDLYDRDVDELGNRLKAADDDLFEAYATAEERTRIEKIRAAMPDGSGINDDALVEVYATAEERTRVEKMERARVEKICAAMPDGVDPDVVAWVVRSESLEEEMRAIAKAIIQRAAAADDCRERHVSALRAVGAGPGRLPRGIHGRDPPSPHRPRPHGRGRGRRGPRRVGVGPAHRRTARVRAQERAAAHDRDRPRLDQRHPRRRAAPRRPNLPRASSSNDAMNHSPAE